MRLAMMAFAAGLLLGPPALAQTTPQSTQPTPTTNTTAPPSHTVGPQDLQNFNLGGTVTRPAPTAPATTAPVSQAPATQGEPATTDQAPVRRARTPAEETARSRPEPTRAQPSRPAAAAPALPAFNPDATSSAPPLTTATPAPTPPAFAPEPDTSSAQLTPSHGPSMLPWLLAAIALAGGVAFLLWRRRPREAFAGASSRYVAPEPPAPSPSPRVAAPPTLRPAPAADAVPPAAAPTLQPAGIVSTRLGSMPAPPPAPPPSPVGIVATRLRPWLDVTLTPVACRFQGDQVGLEFDVELFNSGAAPARDILVEATLFNAGATQEQDTAAFMLRPAGQGDRVEMLPPLQRINFRSSLVVSRADLQTFDMGGRNVFVPVLAYNALYRWSGGQGQTSGSYLVGSETGAEKLAPLRADVDLRTVNGLGGRLLPTAVRQ